jgi:hypothetical protein
MEKALVGEVVAGCLMQRLWAISLRTHRQVHGEVDQAGDFPRYFGEDSGLSVSAYRWP